MRTPWDHRNVAQSLSIHVSDVLVHILLSSGDKTAAHGPIAEGEVSVREEPYSLPQGFSWDTPDLSSPTVVRYCDREPLPVHLQTSAPYLGETVAARELRSN